MAGRNCHYVLNPEETSHILPEHMYGVRQETSLEQLPVPEALTVHCYSSPCTSTGQIHCQPASGSSTASSKHLNHPDLAKTCLEDRAAHTTQESQQLHWLNHIIQLNL